MPDSRLQSKTRLLAPRSVLPRLPRHQLLLLLTKVPAAQSQGKEVVLIEVVEDLPPHLRRELLQKTLGVLEISRVALDFRLASSFGRLLPGSGAARGRRSLSLRHLPCSPRRVSNQKSARARSLDRSRVCALCVASRLLPLRHEGVASLAVSDEAPRSRGCPRTRERY